MKTHEEVKKTLLEVTNEIVSELTSEYYIDLVWEDYKNAIETLETINPDTKKITNYQFGALLGEITCNNFIRTGGKEPAKKSR